MLRNLDFFQPWSFVGDTLRIGIPWDENHHHMDPFGIKYLVHFFPLRWTCKSNMIGVQERCLWFKDGLVEESGYKVEEYSTVYVYYTSTLQR